MIIDSHQHFWIYNPEKHFWITDEMSVLRKDFLPGDLQPLLNKHGVDGCVAVQADMSEAETVFLLQCAAENAFIRGVVGWADLLNERVDEFLEVVASNPSLKGIRHIVQDEPDDRFMEQPLFRNGVSRLEKYGLVYDILVYPRQLPSAIDLVRRFPRQQFVLDHIAKPDISKGIDAQWKKQIQELAEYPNLFCKLSGMVTETRDFKWVKDDFTPFMDCVLEAFGPHRLMFGSDWPVCLLAGSYGAVMDIVNSFVQSLSDTEKQQIMGGNAIKCYGI